MTVNNPLNPGFNILKKKNRFAISLNNWLHKISLYVDDVLIYLYSPRQSIPKLIKLISDYGSFSGYKIIVCKSEAMPLCCSQMLDPNISQPFHWFPTGFSHLGIKVSPWLKDLYRLNYTPLLQNIKQDLDRWCGLLLSLLCRIHLIKMNILPRFLYFFQLCFQRKSCTAK